MGHAVHSVVKTTKKVVKPVADVVKPAVSLLGGASGVGEVLGIAAAGASLVNAFNNKKPKVEVKTISAPPPKPEVKPQVKQPLGGIGANVFQPLNTSFFEGKFGQSVAGRIGKYGLGNAFRLL